jgi:hypothetical protein
MYRIGFFRNLSGTTHTSRLNLASSQWSLEVWYMGVWASEVLAKLRGG